jgi:hypothetical protein
MNGPTKADYELAAMLLNNTAQQGGAIGIGPEARASLARVADYLLQLALTTPPRSTPPPS